MPHRGRRSLLLPRDEAEERIDGVAGRVGEDTVSSEALPSADAPRRGAATTVMARDREGAQVIEALGETGAGTAVATGAEIAAAEIGGSGSAPRAVNGAAAAAGAVAEIVPETGPREGLRARVGSPGGGARSTPWRPSLASASSPRDSGR